MAVVGRMKFGIKPGVGSLDAEKIAVTARGKPALKGVARLLAQGKGDSQLPVRLALHNAQDVFNELCMLFVLTLAALQNNGSIAACVCPFRGPEDFLARHLETANLLVVPADSAVVAVLFADVAVLDNAAKIDLGANLLQFHRIGRLEQGFLIPRFKQRKQRPEVLPRNRPASRDALQECVHVRNTDRASLRPRLQEGARPVCFSFRLPRNGPAHRE